MSPIWYDLSAPEDSKIEFFNNLTMIIYSKVGKPFLQTKQ